jgi:hypothetical protein
MTEAQFRQHWIAKVFRADTAAGPRIVYSSQMAIDQVSRTPGAIAFVEVPSRQRREGRGIGNYSPGRRPKLRRAWTGIPIL